MGQARPLIERAVAARAQGLGAHAVDVEPLPLCELFLELVKGEGQ